MEKQTTMPAALTPTEPAVRKKKRKTGAHPIFLLLLGGVVLLLVVNVLKRL